MKHIKYLVIGCGIMTLSACSDFLEILPLNDVVLQNYWTEKKDVASVMNSCYEGLETTDCISRMSIWGELRSDNITQGASTGWQVSEILKENLLPSNPLCSWEPMYQVINRCNTVIHYAPGVHAKDPNYTYAEMKANIAEATALRALCYFYLIRTFRDVPYSTEPSIDDMQQYIIPATKFDDVLALLIADLESVKNDAVRRYYTDESAFAYTNSSRITRWAIYALLADMYLWQGNYEKSIEYCDLILDYKRSQYDEMKEKYGSISNLFLFNGHPLILEKMTGSTLSGNAYWEIFGKGNSFESIFELYFASNQAVQNTYISDYFVNTTGRVGQLGAPDFLRKDVALGNNKVFRKTDCRAYENMLLSTASRYAITKYALRNVSMNTQNVSSENDTKLSYSMRSSSDANWIVYRMTDIMLIKAEAEIQLGADRFESAFSLINAVNKRANNVTTTATSDTLSYNTFKGEKSAMEELLFQERQRELMFEGKRWFDMVRLVRRDGNTRRAVSMVINKYVDNINAVKIKLADPNIFYYPYHKDEMKVNPKLIQNPAYTNGDNTELTK